MNKKVILVSPIHDPKGQLADEINNNCHKLNSIFGDFAAISVQTGTSPKTIISLEKECVNFYYLPKKNEVLLGDNYKNAIKLGIEKDASHIFLVDFDRALHWANRFPDELKEVKEKLLELKGFTSFVRSTRAFETHPLTQRSTEATINAIASELTDDDVDIMSGAFGMDREFANMFLDNSKRDDFGIYAEMLDMALKNKININTIEVEGLEWETPDQYKEVIEKEGYAKWLNDFESLPEWEKRVKLLEKSTEVLTNGK